MDYINQTKFVKKRAKEREAEVQTQSKITAANNEFFAVYVTTILH